MRHAFWKRAEDVGDPSERGAQTRALVFSGALGAGAAGTGTKLLHEGVSHWSPNLAKHTGKAILPAAVLGGVMGLTDKREEIHRAARGVFRGARNAFGAPSPSAGVDMSQKAASCEVVAHFDGGEQLGRVLLNSFDRNTNLARQQLPELLRTAPQSSAPLAGAFSVVLPSNMTLSGLRRG